MGSGKQSCRPSKTAVEVLVMSVSCCEVAQMRQSYSGSHGAMMAHGQQMHAAYQGVIDMQHT